MEDWKFLLQKDGDRSWLPLDCPDAEILEGRYRLVARSSQVNTDIEIRVCHLSTVEDPPKRRIHKRSSRTNENGLMVVIPFTHLQAGIWELSCFSSDPMSDLIGDTLHHTVCLRVAAPAETEDLDDWGESPYSSDGPDSTAALGEGLAASDEPADPENAPEILVPATIEERGFLPRVYPAPVTAAVLETHSYQQDSPVLALNARTLRLQLQTTALMASRGQLFTLSGQVVVDDLAELEAEIPPALLRSTDYDPTDLVPASNEPIPQPPSLLVGVMPQALQLSLRDPQSSTIILREQQSLPSGYPPLNFTFSVSLPRTLATHLLLGEVVLYGAHPNQPEAAIALQVVPFTVTVDPENLVEELKKVHAILSTSLIEEPSRGEELADLAVQFSAKLRREKLKNTLDLSFLDLTSPTPGLEGLPTVQPAEPPVEAVMVQTAERSLAMTGTPQARPKQILPPQLHPPIERPSGKKRLELPVFDRPLVTATPVPPQEAALIDDLFTAALEDPLEEPLSFKLEEPGQEETAPIILPVADQSAEFASASFAPEAAALPQDEIKVEPNSPQPTAAPHPTSPAPFVAGEDNSLVELEFKSLNLQERFFDRLNQLAEDRILAASLKRSLQPAATETVVIEPEIKLEPASDAAFTEAGAMAKEIVVEDDPSWQDQVLRAPSLRSRLDFAQKPLLALPPDTPIPIPVVEVLTDEITAGQPSRLRVKLPDYLPPTCVKLWVSDRQTRAILDGPRWLMDLSPNGLEEVMTDLEITVPEGCLEIRIEAIAVELQTQRESQKVSLERPVALPELPDLWDDELENF